jgi:hypothetical protein
MSVRRRMPCRPALRAARLFLQSSPSPLFLFTDPCLAMDDKNRILLPIVVFNLVFVFYQLFFNWGADFGWGKLFLAILLGLIAAGITFGVMATMKK